jgi:hypothetical protein
VHGEGHTALERDEQYEQHRSPTREAPWLASRGPFLFGGSLKHAKLPTIIDGAEVFDSAGTLALQVRGFDVLYLQVLWPHGDPDDPHAEERPVPTSEEHDEIINVICEALGVRNW